MNKETAEQINGAVSMILLNKSVTIAASTKAGLQVIRRAVVTDVQVRQNDPNRIKYRDALDDNAYAVYTTCVIGGDNSIVVFGDNWRFDSKERVVYCDASNEDFTGTAAFIYWND